MTDTTTTREYEMNETIPETVIEDGITFHLRDEPWLSLYSGRDVTHGPVRVAIYSRTMRRRSMFE